MEKESNFANFAKKQLVKNFRIHGSEFSGQILLESNQFCTDLLNVFDSLDSNFAFFWKMVQKQQ